MERARLLPGSSLVAIDGLRLVERCPMYFATVVLLLFILPGICIGAQSLMACAQRMVSFFLAENRSGEIFCHHGQWRQSVTVIQKVFKTPTVVEPKEK